MKILLVDDHILFAKSLSIALCDNPEIEQFSSTKDIQDLEKQIATELPDILLIDINLGGLTDGERKVLVVRAFIAVQSTEWNRVGNVWIVIVYVIPSPRFIPLYANSAKWGRAYWLLALDMLLFG